MLAKRIIPCLDVKDGKVVKGIQFKNHQIVGDILELAKFYSQQGADELVFYDITASSESRALCPLWIEKVAAQIDIPFCVAGGIRTLQKARNILAAGADKISINTPALENPELITILSEEFGKQCITIGIDSQLVDGQYRVYQYTGDPSKTCFSQRLTNDWITEVQQRGCGEIVLNCMQSDGVRAGYDLQQLTQMRSICKVPIVASGGAGSIEHFVELFQKINVSGALAASVFHKGMITIPQLKQVLNQNNIEVRYV